jgi:hypothetical protein
MKNPAPIIRFDPNTPVDLTPLRIGEHIVRRARLPGTNYLRYSTMHGEEVAGRQISYPTAADCAGHIRNFTSVTSSRRQRAALLDTDLHDNIIGILRTKEMDARDLCRMFAKTSTVMSPVLSMLIAEQRIARRGTERRPIFTAQAQQPAHP